MLSSGSTEQLRVFDLPACEEISPLFELSSQQWAILGLESMRNIRDYIDAGSPQLSEEEVIEAWTNFLSDSTVFYTLNKTPGELYCSDGTGIDISPFSTGESYGGEFEWHFEDARLVDKNAAWLVTDHNRYLMDIGKHELTENQRALAASNPDCSVEEGRRYFETVVLGE